MLHSKSWNKKSINKLEVHPSQKIRRFWDMFQYTRKTISTCNRALSWNCYTAWVQKAVHFQRTEEHEEGTEPSPQRVPSYFWAGQCVCCTRASSPLYICMTGRPMPHQSGHLQESSFPLWRTWACHAKALPHRLLLQAMGETQKEAEELKKAIALSF